MTDLRRLPWRLRYQYAARIGSWRRRVAVRATHLHADVIVARSAYLGPGFGLAIPGPATLRIGERNEFRRDFFCEIAAGGVVEFADDVIFTSSALIQISTSLTIGRRAVFGQAVMIADGNHKFRDHTQHLLDQGYEFRPITIGDNAIVTSKCTILNSIGDGAVIGANSVVTKPVPAFCLAVGAPARVVEYFGPSELRPEAMG